MKKNFFKEDTSLTLFKSKKKAKLTHKKLKFPLFTHINLDSHFIYDENNSIQYFETTKNKNLIKLTEEETSILKNIIQDINTQKLLSNAKENLIEIPEELAKKINDFIIKPIKEHNELSDFIQGIMIDQRNRQNISCRKLAALYEEKYKKKISKSTVHRILRKKLNLRYLKTTYKNRKIQTDKNRFYSLYFIKVFVKLIKLGFETIFIDESKFELMNNHFRCWRKNNEQIYFGPNNNKKNNILLAIDKSNVIYYKMFEENNNSNNFIKFLEELKSEIEKKKIEKYVLILDNCTIHKTQNIINFFVNNKINALFTPAYQSTFTPIELAFRAIKKITYSKIYIKIDDVINEIDGILKDEKIKKTLLYNYKETLSEYLSYIDINNNINLNNLNIE